MAESQRAMSRMTQDVAVNIGKGQVMQNLECYGRNLGVYSESNRELVKGITCPCQSFIAMFTGCKGGWPLSSLLDPCRFHLKVDLTICSCKIRRIFPDLN